MSIIDGAYTVTTPYGRTAVLTTEQYLELRLAVRMQARSLHRLVLEEGHSGKSLTKRHAELLERIAEILP